MADHRPGFTPGKGGERAGRADARPRLTCSLATVSQEFAMRFSDAVKRHRAHGGDLGQCDALRCSCGNEPHLNGFHTVNLIGDGRWVVADPAAVRGAGLRSASAAARCTQNRMSSSSWPRSHHRTDGDLSINLPAPFPRPSPFTEAIRPSIIGTNRGRTPGPLPRGAS
jgi:hypothetical protein